MIFVLDNYDSFTYNLVHLMGSLGAEMVVERNRETSVAAIMAMRPDGILLSPGPSRPENAGCMLDLIHAAAGRIPMLGVCLGHQAIGHAFGAKVVSAKRIMHGKLSTIHHDGKGVFQNVPQDFKAVRYHSLALEEATLPDCLEITARSEDGEIMGVRHKELPIEGIQYHPESIMTEAGRQQLMNFLNRCRGEY
ncbi:MAG: aminodeoxychorismate/anthranilate synthase component II [Lentisphaeria bacterium]|jgi:anthranilate synthase/aminodeoxychorismate synthase-like glutamine amidotransferase|nr:aminodeoxychorismate/anthranilate synthase component II [Lentisphaeria bacterium]